MRSLRYAISGILALVSLIPFVFMLLISFEHHRVITGNPLHWIPTEPTLSTYTDVLSLSGFPGWLFNSSFVAVVATLAVLFVQSLAAYAFACKRFVGREVLFYLVLAGLMVPGAMTLIPQFLITSRMGLLNSYAGLILPTLAGPLGVFLLRQYMLGIPVSLLDAARIDGCREWAIYWRIVLPLSLPALGTLAIISFTGHWREFLWPLLVTTDDSMKTLPVGLASLSSQFNTDYGAQMAGALLSLLPVIVVFLCLQRYFIGGLTTGAVKE
jgi:multiple sugar transport system permease protein